MLDFNPTLCSRDNMADISIALQQVCQIFGITELNPLQEEAITSFVINKTDVFVNLPTGFGKSLIYQALPLISDVLLEAPGHVVAAISPLVNLMKDQVEKLTSLQYNLSFDITDSSSVGIKSWNDSPAKKESIFMCTQVLGQIPLGDI